MSYILLTQEEARTKLKVSYADYKRRIGAQLVATKGLPKLKHARIEIGDRIVSINGEDVSEIETSKIVKKLHTTEMNGKVWIEFCPVTFYNFLKRSLLKHCVRIFSKFCVRYIFLSSPMEIYEEF